MNKNMLEIERKYLVKPFAFDGYFDRSEITQGYLVKNELGSVRVRIESNLGSQPKAYLMSKTKIDVCSNNETVDEISIENAEVLILKFSRSVVRKTRYIKIINGKKWEIDYFHSPNNGLILAEIELGSVDEKVDLPEWIEREVTGESKYYNANM